MRSQIVLLSSSSSKRSSPFNNRSSPPPPVISELIRANTKSEFFDTLRKLRQKGSQDNSHLTTSPLLATRSSSVAKKIQEQQRQQNISSSSSLSSHQFQQDQHSIDKNTSSTISIPQQIPWAYVRHSDEVLESSSSYLMSLKLPKNQGFRAFVGKNGMGLGVSNKNTSKNNNIIDVDFEKYCSTSAITASKQKLHLFPLPVLSNPNSYLYHRISPLQPLFEEFPDLVLEGTIARVFDENNNNNGEVDIGSSVYSDLIKYSSSVSNNKQENDDRTTLDEAAALFSATQFYTYDIARMSSIFSQQQQLYPSLSSFEIRTQLLYKMLKFCVDPKYLQIVGNPITRKRNDQKDQEDSCCFDDFLNQYRSASSVAEIVQQKSICFLGNIVLLNNSSDDEHEEEENVNFEDQFLAACERFNDSVSNNNTCVEGIVIRKSTTTNDDERKIIYLHVPREESEFQIVKFVSSENHNHQDVESKKVLLKSVKCLAKTGAEFEVPLYGVSDEIREKLWNSTPRLMLSKKANSSGKRVFAVVEYSSIEKGKPLEPLVKRIVVKKK